MIYIISRTELRQELNNLEMRYKYLSDQGIDNTIKSRKCLDPSLEHCVFELHQYSV